jgi:hypothetical protein
MTGETSDPPDDSARMKAWRRQLMTLMLAMTFAGGALFGLLASALSLPASWWAPAILAVTGLFYLFLGRR